MSQHTKDIETSIITSAINNMRKTYETDNQVYVQMIPETVDAYLEEDDEYDKNMKYGKIFKAVTFYRKSETICSYYLKQCCPVPFNDWLQSDYFFDENELQSRHFCNISFYNSAYDAKVQEWFARNAENKDDDIDINSVELWLSNEVNLRQYIDNFLSNGFDDINVIPEIMTENELIEIGVDKKGHRKKIMLFIDKLKKSSGEIGVSDIVKIKKQYPQKFKSLLAKMENNKTITNSSSTTETTEDVESTKYTHLGTEEQDMKLLSVKMSDLV
eukprot:269945_1